jgi:hypothetical protein
VYGILGEDSSDADTLKVLVRRLAIDQSLSIKTKGFNGCSEMLRKGAAHLRAFANLGCTQFVICHDADESDPSVINEKVMSQIVRKAEISQGYCVIVPVQELEAWILADIQAVSKVFTSWKPQPISNPEGIRSPKEYLEKLSQASNHKPRYAHAVHNARVAEHLDIDLVMTKCPSFLPLATFVRKPRRGS